MKKVNIKIMKKTNFTEPHVARQLYFGHRLLGSHRHLTLVSPLVRVSTWQFYVPSCLGADKLNIQLRCQRNNFL